MIVDFYKTLKQEINNYFRNNGLPEDCVKVKIAHTYSKEMSLEERENRYKIINKYKK